MTLKRNFYTSSEINWFRRYSGINHIKTGLTKMLCDKDQNGNFVNQILLKTYLNSNSPTANNRTIKRENKKFVPELYFHQTELEKVLKIRDIFYDFDDDKSRTLDIDEIYTMFNINNIPISKKELYSLFQSKKKEGKSLTLFEIVQLVSDSDKAEKFSNAMRKIQVGFLKKNEKKYIPNNLDEMFQYLNEQGKIRDDLKVIKRNINRINKLENDMQSRMRSRKSIIKEIGLKNFLVQKFMRKVQYKEAEDSFANILEISKKKIFMKSPAIHYNSPVMSKTLTTVNSPNETNKKIYTPLIQLKKENPSVPNLKYKRFNRNFAPISALNNYKYLSTRRNFNFTQTKLYNNQNITS